MSLFLITSFTIAGCAKPATPESTPQASKTDFAITSSAFAEGAEIPVKYACDGQNISPPLDWIQSPAGTASFAMIMDDADAA